MTDLTQLHFNEEVEVTAGEHKGRTGNVMQARTEKDNVRLQLKVGEYEVIFVDIKDCRKLHTPNGNIDSMDAKLFIPEDKHAAWDQRMEELDRWSEGDPDYTT